MSGVLPGCDLRFVLQRLADLVQPAEPRIAPADIEIEPDGVILWRGDRLSLEVHADVRETWGRLCQQCHLVCGQDDIKRHQEPIQGRH